MLPILYLREGQFASKASISKLSHNKKLYKTIFSIIFMPVYARIIIYIIIYFYIFIYLKIFENLLVKSIINKVYHNSKTNKGKISVRYDLEAEFSSTTFHH